MTPGVKERDLVRMTPDEVQSFLEERHTMSIATVGASGAVHLVAIWYGFVEGRLVIETKARSQKVANLRRDPRFTALVEAGETYDQLRGVELGGRATIVDDWATLWKIGCSVFERYMGPVTSETEPLVERTLNKRVGIFLHLERTVSWDHRKLGLTT
ncbi:MAG: pyridoxamine 5'-phosphate oxidase family protein [Acidimicrobiia bacterium]